MDYEAQKQYVKMRYPKAIAWEWKDWWSIYSKYPSGITLGYGRTKKIAWAAAYEYLKSVAK